MLFFGKSVSLGFLFCLARHPQQNTLGLVGKGLYLEASEESMSSFGLQLWEFGRGMALWGVVFIWQSLLTSSKREGCFGSVVEWHLVKKTTKGKWGGLGFYLRTLLSG